MTGSVMLSMDEQNAIAADGLYLDVYSPAHPNGEVRGQLMPPNSVVYVALASGSQEVPAVQSTYAAHGSFILSADQTTVRYHVATSAVPTDMHLRRAIGSLSGPVVYPLTPIGQSIDGTITLGATGMDVTDLQNGHFYLNVATAANMDGELRGQILAPGQTLFAGALSGANEVPPTGSTASGGAQFILSADQSKMHYEAVMTGVIPTSAEVDNAAAGLTGPMIYQLTLSQMQVLGDTTMAAGDLAKFMGGAAYLNVHTASYATGELRAQLVRP
jgi:hypothetical protein